MREVLDGLPLRKKIKTIILNRYTKIEEFFKQHPQYIIFLNTYGFSGLLVGIFFYIVMSIWLDVTWIRFISTIIASVIGLIYIEHYWYWFKVAYKDHEFKK